MKIQRPNRVLAAWVVASALQMGARADTIVQTFTQTVPLTGSPPGSVSFNTVWNINQYDGFGGLTSLTGVKYELSTQIFYQGTLVSVASGLPFNLVVQSDFNFVLPGTSGQITALDPSIAYSGTMPSVAGTTLAVPASGGLASSIPTATQFALDLASYVGGGVVSVAATGELLTTTPAAGTRPFQNTSDIGEASPYVFVDQTKVYPLFGLQQFSLVGTMTVTYTVPEASTYAAVAGLVGLVGWHCWARRRNS
ncbi:MAG: hypothetical protein DVB31_16720 [Verrucomicrobia bacterium]|nr:MAG: hypothetical protein DVB31_16720 [Verrucomicrobiota bacterium]